jgi:hypothetical protein
MEKRTEFKILLPNEPGQLARVAEALGNRQINIITIAAIGVANPQVVLVTVQEDETREILKKLGLSFQEAELLSVKMPNVPGELGIFAKKLADANINIESMYLLEESFGEVRIGFTVDDLDKAKQELGL